MNRLFRQYRFDQGEGRSYTLGIGQLAPILKPLDLAQCGAVLSLQISMVQGIEPYSGDLARCEGFAAGGDESVGVGPAVGPEVPVLPFRTGRSEVYRAAAHARFIGHRIRVASHRIIDLT